jgi:hypothetical protein
LPRGGVKNDFNVYPVQLKIVECLNHCRGAEEPWHEEDNQFLLARAFGVFLSVYVIDQRRRMDLQ